MKKPRLVCIGDLMLDVVVRAAADVEAGTDTPGSVRFRLGGSAVNTSRAFVSMGGSASFVGAVGTDSIGKRLAAALSSAGVDTHLVRVNGPTPRLAAVIEPDGERSFVTDRGVADSVHASDLKRRWLARADALHLPAYSLLRAPLSEASMRAVALARAGGVLVSVDLASRGPLLAAGAGAVRDTLRAMQPNVVFANRDEASAVGGLTARRLITLAPIVVLKQGHAGCRVVWRDAAGAVLEIEVATRPIAAVDTTGAGDAFDAGFLYQLLVTEFDVAAPSAALLRRAALAGHRSAARLLTSARPELAL